MHTRLSLLFLLAACAGNADKDTASAVGDDGGGADGGDGGDGGDGADGGDGTETFPELTSETCGSAEFSYLPLEDMGRLVEYERDSAFSMPAAAIQVLLDTAGYSDVIDVQYDVELYKVRHITQDRGESVEVTGYVALPVMPEPTAVPTVLWLHPTMGFGDECAPTAGSLEGVAFPVLWATQGYAVAAPDYIGMAGWGEPSDRLHPWVVGEPTAIASLDSLRATANLQAELETNAVPDLSRVLGFGASQGGHAALFADHYAKAYAPEVDFMAVIAAIPVTDLRALAVYGATHEADATLALAGGMVTMWDWYGREADLDAVLQPAVAEALPEVLGDACEDFGSLLPGIESVEDVYTPAFLASAVESGLDDMDPWNCYMDQSSLLANTAVPALSLTPKLIITGSADTLAWAPPVRADAETMCAAGVPVELVECEGLGHVGAAVDSLGLMVSWANDRVAGVPLTECTLNAAGPRGG